MSILIFFFFYLLQVINRKNNLHINQKLTYHCSEPYCQAVFSAFRETDGEKVFSNVNIHKKKNPVLVPGPPKKRKIKSSSLDSHTD